MSSTSLKMVFFFRTDKSGEGDITWKYSSQANISSGGWLLLHDISYPCGEGPTIQQLIDRGLKKCNNGYRLAGDNCGDYAGTQYVFSLRTFVPGVRAFLFGPFGGRAAD
mmetsp:Transcript_8253/g.18985  ORF Transcript_8253/g.18985 Transcript_8253/m.18985 type:complete len:109 (-) Transcript_8253:165-491(-)